MRKILISVLALVFCSFISNAYAEDTKKYEEIDIEKHHHFDIGVGGYSFQLRYGYDLTPYNQIGFKTGIGSLASINSDYMHGAAGGDISLEDKAYFIKSSKYYSKNNSIRTSGYYFKSFVSLVDNMSSIDPAFGKNDPVFTAVGAGLGYDFVENHMGVSIGLDLGTTIQMKNNKLGGVVFLRPEINYKLVF